MGEKRRPMGGGDRGRLEVRENRRRKERDPERGRNMAHRRGGTGQKERREENGNRNGKTWA